MEGGIRMPRGAAGAHHAAGQGGFVAARGSTGRQHAHGDNGGAHDAGGGGEHGGNQDHGQTQSALQGPQQVTDGLKQAVRHLEWVRKLAISTNIGMATME